MNKQFVMTVVAGALAIAGGNMLWNYLQKKMVTA